MITVPQGAFLENVTLVAKLVEGDPFGENKQNTMLQLEGLPADYSLPIDVKIARNSDADFAIMLLEDVFTRSLNGVSETVVPLETSVKSDTLIAEIPVIDNTKSASAINAENKANIVRLVKTEYGNVGFYEIFDWKVWF